MRLLLPVALLASSVSHAAVPVEPKVQIPEGAALTEAIRTADEALFTLFFDGCDPVRLEKMVTADHEFYHDRGGVTAHDGKEFMAGYAKSCTEKKKPDAWRLRRELIPDTLHVDPVPGYGAMEFGEHYFYERQGDGPEKRTGHAKFAMLWKLEGGVWKLARVFSYAHRSVE